MKDRKEPQIHPEIMESGEHSWRKRPLGKELSRMVIEYGLFWHRRQQRKRHMSKKQHGTGCS